MYKNKIVDSLSSFRRGDRNQSIHALPEVKFLLLGILLVAMLILAACGDATPVPTLTLPTTEPVAQATLTTDQESLPSPTTEPEAELTTTSPTDVPETATPEPTLTPSPTDTPDPTEVPLPSEIDNNGFPMVLVEGGLFRIGDDPAELIAACEALSPQCPPRYLEPSGPPRTVVVDTFYIDVFEVTNQAYAEFLNELGANQSACMEQDCLIVVESKVEVQDGQFVVEADLQDLPVAGVTWYGAQAFCEWRGARLPYEAEWEKAAAWNPETGDKTRYPWGDEFDGNVLNFCDVNCEEPLQANQDFDDGYVREAPVGSYEGGRSPVGAYDMAGNVWEWVFDWFNPDQYRQGSLANPTGPESGEERVVRGGSWFDAGIFTSSVFRFGTNPIPPADGNPNLGFRCAVSS